MSLGGFCASLTHGLYSATKHALKAPSEALAGELRPFGVRVAVVEPGAIVIGFNDKEVPPPAMARASLILKHYYHIGHGWKQPSGRMAFRRRKLSAMRCLPQRPTRTRRCSYQ